MEPRELKVSIGVAIDPSTLKLIERRRGSQTRSVFLRQLITTALEAE